MPPVLLTCPICGEPLTARVPPSSEHPPLLSPGCARSWWPSELTAQARVELDRHRRTLPATTARAVAANIRGDKIGLAELLATGPDEADVARWARRGD